MLFARRCSYQGASELIIASTNGHHEVAKLLIEAGVDINAADKVRCATVGPCVFIRGSTPTMLSIYQLMWLALPTCSTDLRHSRWHRLVDTWRW
jgi:hypothetical protein